VVYNHVEKLIYTYPNQKYLIGTWVVTCAIGMPNNQSRQMTLCMNRTGILQSK